MESLSILDEENQKSITETMASEPAEKLLVLSKDIQNEKILKQRMEILVERVQEEFTKNLYFLLNWQNVIDRLLEICILQEDESSVLIVKSAELYEKFQNIVRKQKGSC